jgi:hypothetical protein
VISDRMVDVLGRLNTSDSDLAAECAVLLGVDGIAVSLVVEGSVTELVLACGVASTRFEEAQFTLGEGPGPDVVRSGAAVLEPDLAAVRAGRWPGLLPAAEALPVRAVFCFPLSLGAISVGVLTGVRSTAGAMSEQELDDALVLATAMTMLLLGGDGLRLESWCGTETPQALRQAVVHQATGMISVQLDGSLPMALLRLRAYAYSNDRPVGEVAADVVARRLRFSDDMSGPQASDEVARG